MSALTPALSDAFALLREDICTHLEQAEELADQDDEWSAEEMEQARELISNLVLGIRGLMIEHKLWSHGGCRTCASPWPCSVISTIHGFVKDPESQFVKLTRQSQNEN